MLRPSIVRDEPERIPSVTGGLVGVVDNADAQPVIVDPGIVTDELSVGRGISPDGDREVKGR